MMRVDFYTIKTNPDKKRDTGPIHFLFGSVFMTDDGKLEARPSNDEDNRLLNWVMDEAILVNGRLLHPVDTPIEWFNNACFARYGSYLHATEPIVVEAVQESTVAQKKKRLAGLKKPKPI